MRDLQGAYLYFEGLLTELDKGRHPRPPGDVFLEYVAQYGLSGIMENGKSVILRRMRRLLPRFRLF